LPKRERMEKKNTPTLPSFSTFRGKKLKIGKSKVCSVRPVGRKKLACVLFQRSSKKQKKESKQARMGGRQNTGGGEEKTKVIEVRGL